MKKTFLVSMESTDKIMESIWSERLEKLIKSNLWSTGVKVVVTETPTTPAQ